MADADDTLHYGLHRLVVLSDAVFAIAMTLLALELRPPAVWNGSIGALLAAMRTSLTAYGISFVMIGAYWTGHCQTFRHIARADNVLTVLTIIALGLVTLLPVATRLLIEHEAAPGALAVYLGLITGIGVVNALIWAYCTLRPAMIHPHVTRAQKVERLVRLFLAPVVALVLGLLAFRGQATWAALLLAALAAAVSIARRARRTVYAGEKTG